MFPSKQIEQEISQLTNQLSLTLRMTPTRLGGIKRHQDGQSKHEPLKRLQQWYQKRAGYTSYALTVPSPAHWSRI